MDKRYCRHGVKENDPCMDCIREEKGGPQPDRAARIRALAEKMIESTATLSASGAFSLAMQRLDELDRLEAAEREKERET